MFIDDLKVNTDGTKISYYKDDYRGKFKAINNVLNAMPRGAEFSDYIAFKSNGFRPASAKARMLPDVIEHRKAVPCIGDDGYFVSMTSVPAKAGAYEHVGNCDQSKWLDALSVPALVLPRGNTEFQARGAANRNYVVAMALDHPTRIAYGIVGDKGPADELGEASVAMNRILRGLPASENPANYSDAVKRFQAPRSIVLIFPGKAQRAKYPITASSVQQEVKSAFADWGGAKRLQRCAQDLAP